MAVSRLKSEREKAPSVDVGNRDEYDDSGIKSATQKEARVAAAVLTRSKHGDLLAAREQATFCKHFAGCASNCNPIASDLFRL